MFNTENKKKNEYHIQYCSDISDLEKIIVFWCILSIS